MIDASPTVNLVVVYNPLDISDRVETMLEWGFKKPLSFYLEGLPDGVTWAACVNAEPIEQHLWAETYLEPDDFLTIMPIPEGGGGGGGGKTIMRMVAMVAVAIAAVYTGGAAAAAWGEGMMGPTLSGLTLDAAMAGGTIGTAISVGVGALVTPPATMTSALLPKELAA